jgi:hypothetical protein
MNQHSVALCS